MCTPERTGYDKDKPNSPHIHHFDKVIFEIFIKIFFKRFSIKSSKILCSDRDFPVASKSHRKEIKIAIFCIYSSKDILCYFN